MTLPPKLGVKYFYYFAWFCLILMIGSNVSATEVAGRQAGRWTLANSPYILTGDVEVPADTSLKIEPGVVVKFAGYYRLRVHGALIANGVVGKRVIFTSIHDKEFGVTGQPTTEMPSNEDWNVIEFLGANASNSSLEYCIIRYSDKALLATAANPTLKHIIIADCKAKNFVINGKTMVIMEGNEHDYVPIETTLNENIVTEPAPTPPPVEKSPVLPPQVGKIFTEKEFTFGEIRVVSAARKEQRISQAPASITVITEDDIKFSGAITIPDVLRMVPGLDVMAITASDMVVNARGYNKEMSNKMLVLIDGRYVYWDFYGIILWDSFPIVLEDIKRIEIIRGPGAALYGANAFSGIINIITKSPQEIKGTHVSAIGGTYNTYLGSIIHAGGNDKLSYKMTMGMDETGHWNDKAKISRNVKRAQALVQYQFDNHSKLLLEAGYNRGQGETLSGIGRMNRKQRMIHLKMNMDLEYFNMRMFWSRSRGDAIREPGSTPYYFIANTYDIESLLHFNTGAINSVILGANFRLNIAESDLIDQNHRQNLMAGYIQDEFRLSDRFILTFGLRYDIHPLVKNQLSPRANISISPFKNHYLRLSYGSAFRNPSFIESYLYEDSDITAMISPKFPANTFMVQARGNSSLLPEKITSSEIGYQAQFTQKLRMKIDLFYNKLGDFISFKTIKYNDISSHLGYPAGTVIIPAAKSYTNGGKSRAIGGELSIDLLPAKWLMAAVNYSYQKLTWENDDPLTPQNETGQLIKSSPRHKINGNLRLNFGRGLTANLMAHYVSETEKNETWAAGKVPAYLLINVRLGYRFLNETTEIGLSIFNLFDKRHFEYPGWDLQGHPSGAHQICRRITALFLSRTL